MTDHAPTPQSACPLPLPDQVAQMRETVALLDRITSAQANLLKAHFGIGCRPLTTRELADLLGCSQSSAARRVGEALDAMRGLMGVGGGEA